MWAWRVNAQQLPSYNPAQDFFDAPRPDLNAPEALLDAHGVEQEGSESEVDRVGGSTLVVT